VTDDQTIPADTDHAALAEWAEAGDFDPHFAGGQALHGAAAAAAGRTLLKAAGVDLDAVERAVGRRLRLDPAAPRGARSPRVNVAIPESMDNRPQAVVSRSVRPRTR